MGITGTQYVVFRHKDQPHGHVHIAYNRVRNDGTAITGDSNFRKSIAVTKALTREYGLTFGKGKKNVRRERLRGKDAVKYRLYDAIREAMKNSHDWQSLRAALEAKGIRMAVVQRAGGSGRTGIIFTYGKMTFSGGQIDRSLTYNRINQAMEAVSQTDAADASMHRHGQTAALLADSLFLPLLSVLTATERKPPYRLKTHCLTVRTVLPSAATSARRLWKSSCSPMPSSPPEVAEEAMTEDGGMTTRKRRRITSHIHGGGNHDEQETHALKRRKA